MTFQLQTRAAVSPQRYRLCPQRWSSCSYQDRAQAAVAMRG